MMLEDARRSSQPLGRLLQIVVIRFQKLGNRSKNKSFPYRSNHVSVEICL